jgi:hypothetical protein
MVKIPYSALEDKDIPDIPIKNWVLMLLSNSQDEYPCDAFFIMMKTFLLTKEVIPSLDPKFDFTNSNGGPYSDKVALSITQLLSTKMLELNDDPKAFGGKSIILTKAGKEKAVKLKHRLPSKLRINLEFLGFSSIKMGQLGMIQYIYSNYPQYIFLPESGDAFV